MLSARGLHFVPDSATFEQRELGDPFHLSKLHFVHLSLLGQNLKTRRCRNVFVNGKALWKTMSDILMGSISMNVINK